MGRKLLIFASLAAILSAAGCMKDTYDMDKLSKWAHLSPVFAISAVRGDISLSDLLEPGENVVFDEDNFVRLVFRKDSVLEFVMADYYDLNDMITFSESYPVGPMSIAPFQGSVTFTLDDISLNFDAGLRAQFVALDGTEGDFPAFPPTDLGQSTYLPFTNFEYATFSQGSLDVIVYNNLTAPLSGATVTLYNTSGLVYLGTANITSQIEPGNSGIASVNIAGKLVRSQITARISLNGSPGAEDVSIDLSASNIEIEIAGRDMKVVSGRVILPENQVLPESGNDMVTFDPGEDIEITEFKIIAGDLTGILQSATPATASVHLELPEVKRGGAPVTEVITVGPMGSTPAAINLSNTVSMLDTDPLIPYNRIPFKYTIVVSSNNNMINFSSLDEIQIDLELINPDFDYVKGYFGQDTETIEPDTLDLEIEDILEHFTGDFLLSSPSIKLNYSNSFSLPIEVNLSATAYRESEILNLDLDPFSLAYPSAPGERDVTRSFTIDKTNSTLPELVSMPPEKVRFAGSAVMNPQGNTGARDNYIFGNSRFIGSLEIEVPLDLRINNVQFADTTDNFMKNDDPDADSPVNAEDFEFLRVDITAENGFPLGVSLSMILYDSETSEEKAGISASDILKPAPVDANGKVTSPENCVTSIEITREFWNSVNSADNIIFKFTLNTTDSGSRDVKIYSDYRIDFKAALVLKPDIRFDLD